jgi:predicted amidophosphoribosyltransferase
MNKQELCPHARQPNSKNEACHECGETILAVETYACPSYVNDGGELVDCKCGKCSIKDEDWRGLLKVT